MLLGCSATVKYSPHRDWLKGVALLKRQMSAGLLALRTIGGKDDEEEEDKGRLKVLCVSIELHNEFEPKLNKISF